jgi:hypothetical protein
MSALSPSEGTKFHVRIAPPRVVPLSLELAALGVFSMALPVALIAQAVPPALESPGRATTNRPHGEKLMGMPKFYDPASYAIDEHTGYQPIFDGKTLAG